MSSASAIACAATALFAAMSIWAKPVVAAQPRSTVAAKAAVFAPTRFSVVIEGAGPDVILVPGLASPRAVWEGARPALTGYRRHLVQINGFGGTAPGVNAEGAILAPTVEELHRYVVANRLQAPAVVGHSMGGLIGMMLARAHPESVGKLMIVDALPFFATLLNPEATVESVTPQATAMRGAMFAMGERQKTTGRRPSAPIPYMSITRPNAEKVALWSAQSDPFVSGQAMYETMTTDMRATLPAIRTPMTMLYPYSSKSFGADRAKAIYGAAYRSAPNLRLVAVPESFHFIMLDQPALFATALRTFLTEKR